MKLLYEREENNEQVIVIFKPYSMYALLFVLTSLIVLTFVPAFAAYVALGNILMFVAAFIVIVRIIMMFKINQEIRQAMNNGKVTISGGKLSKKNPLTFVIKKA